MNRVHARFRRDGYHIVYRVPDHEVRNVISWLSSLGAFSEIWADREIKEKKK